MPPSRATQVPTDVQAWRVPLDSPLSPQQAVLTLRADTRPFALVGEWFGGTTILGSEPIRVGSGDEDPFALISAQPQVSGGEALVGGGWVGWLGYNLGARIERLPPPPPAPNPRPDFSLAFYDHVVVHDGERWWFEALRSEGRELALNERLELWRARLRQPPSRPRPTTLTPFTLASNGALGHIAAVADCRERIAAGELFQANLTLRLEARLEGELVDLFSRALPLAQPRFGALVDGSLSLSPERFLRRQGREVSAEPIKGTRPRSTGANESEPALEELLSSAKDAAEHVMIVDLMRNDLGRVCRYGSVRAEPIRPEPHAGVWHLVSTVSGELRGSVSDADLLRATFPPGSVTGAPKVQSMKVIAALEATRRELYTGAVGIASPLAGLDLSVAIRCFETSGEAIWFGAGGGIVADSDPQLELDEAITKASGPVAAIGGTLAPVRALPAATCAAPATAAARRDARPAPALLHGDRPDPSLGVFETLLVQDGRPIRLYEHLHRLLGSVATLYGANLDRDAIATRALAVAADCAPGRWRMRIIAPPGAQIDVTAVEAGEPPSHPLTLLPFTLPGGLGAHKWLDRKLLDALTAAAGGAIPLLVDTDGAVLEAAYANVWIREGENLITPPADGRILPGVIRAARLADDPHSHQERFDLERLIGADAVLLTSSISGTRSAGVRALFTKP